MQPEREALKEFMKRFSPREGCELQLPDRRLPVSQQSFSPREGCELQLFDRDCGEGAAAMF